MLKINLNKTKKAEVFQDQTHSTGLATAGSTLFTNLKTLVGGIKSDVITPVLIVKIIINISLIVFFPLGLKIYEMIQINKLETQKKATDDILAGAQLKLDQLRKELSNYDHLKDLSQEFVRKKNFLQGLAEKRLVIPRTIDLIQNNTPKTVWLEHIKLNLSDEKNTVEISGKSFNENHVNSFATSLHNILDKNSITLETQDIKEGESIVKVDFDLKGVM